MVEALIFTGGMLVGGAVATVTLCCVMINNSKFSGQKEIKEPNQTKTE